MVPPTESGVRLTAARRLFTDGRLDGIVDALLSPVHVARVWFCPPCASRTHALTVELHVLEGRTIISYAPMLDSTPPPPPAAPAMPPPTPYFCGSPLCTEEVWDTHAANGWGTCGQQIVWARDYVEELTDTVDACRYIALSDGAAECAPCYVPPPQPPPSPPAPYFCGSPTCTEVHHLTDPHSPR